jgi:hypothetical protein
MPSAKCPVCGSKFHVRLAIPLEEWLRKFPDRQVGELAPVECPGCFIDLKPGYRVRVRLVPQELAGEVGLGSPGTVAAIEGESEAMTYIVEVPSRSAERFPGRFTRRQSTWLGRE